MTATNICSANHAMPSAADTTHGACSLPGEKVAVALVLNRADWLTQIDYTIPEAIERSGAEWVAVIPQIARQLTEEE